jgi:hypothetical protein
MADAKAEAEKLVAENRARFDENEKKHAETIGKSHPTPTQKENDLAAVGAHVDHKEDDGSGPDPFVQQRDLRAQSSGGTYATRASTPRASPASRATTE